MATQTVEQDVRIRRWTREEYHRMAEAGILGPDERLELIEGEIFAMSPQRSHHATGVRFVEDALRAAYPKGYDVRTQLPLAFSDSEPEPDAAVVEGTAADYREAHPSSAVLVVEVSDTTLKVDQTRKRALYARQQISEYWILNLVDGCLEVHRRPSGETYQEAVMLERGATVTPPQSDAKIAVADLLP